MNRTEFIESIKDVKIKEEILDQVKEVYGEDVPELILQILSVYDKPELFDENESRTLSLREVLNAEEDNGIPFKSKKIIPIADRGDNDYIVYNVQAKTWAMYNIVDETLFDSKESFEELFLA